MRAVADNADLAQVSGINIQMVVRVTWIIAGGLACLAGTMLALDVTLKPDLAFNIILPIFAAAIVGGFGQPYGRDRRRLPDRLRRGRGRLQLGDPRSGRSVTPCRTGCRRRSRSCRPSTRSPSPS